MCYCYKWPHLHFICISFTSNLHISFRCEEQQCPPDTYVEGCKGVCYCYDGASCASHLHLIYIFLVDVRSSAPLTRTERVVKECATVIMAPPVFRTMGLACAVRDLLELNVNRGRVLRICLERRVRASVHVI